MSITVRRTGRTSRYWNNKQYQTRLRSDPAEDIVTIAFYLNAKGGGDTRVEVRIDSDSFAEIAKAMIASDPAAAIHAFGEALSSYDPPGTSSD